MPGVACQDALDLCHGDEHSAQARYGAVSGPGPGARPSGVRTVRIRFENEKIILNFEWNFLGRKQQTKFILHLFRA